MIASWAKSVSANGMTDYQSQLRFKAFAFQANYAFKLALNAVWV